MAISEQSLLAFGAQLMSRPDTAQVVIDLYRVAINPAKELSIITEELLKFELSGQVLADTLKSATGDLGQFGRIVLL